MSDGLNDKWLKLLEEWAKDKTQPLPPCPKCRGKMESWDLWLVTGETCKSCGWTSNEGCPL